MKDEDVHIGSLVEIDAAGSLYHGNIGLVMYRYKQYIDTWCLLIGEEYLFFLSRDFKAIDEV